VAEPALRHDVRVKVRRERAERGGLWHVEKLAMPRLFGSPWGIGENTSTATSMCLLS
jgi:hypothetical protein